MSTVALTAGFIPLVDAAPLIIARELRFAEEEGLDLTLRNAPSWSTLRDLLVLGQIEAAHMLAPVPVAMALGLGGLNARIDALMVLSVNGNTIGVSTPLAARMRAAGFGFDFSDARAAGRALIAACEARARIGVPFPFSMHAELLYRWLGAMGIAVPQELSVKTVPPPLMAEAMAEGEIDAFCVGSPWGSIAVENGVGELLLPTSAIWGYAPEKVLAVRHDWATNEPDLTRRLMRATWRAGRWLDEPANRMTAAEILSRAEYLGVSAEVVERALTGHLVISPRGETRQVDRYLAFTDHVASFPWRSQAVWIASQMAARMGLDRSAATRAAREVFRSDLYRENLRDLGVELPGASERIEGGLSDFSMLQAESGELLLAPDRFFDGQIFDPMADN